MKVRSQHILLGIIVSQYVDVFSSQERAHIKDVRVQSKGPTVLVTERNKGTKQACVPLTWSSFVHQAQSSIAHVTKGKTWTQVATLLLRTSSCGLTRT